MKMFLACVFLMALMVLTASGVQTVISVGPEENLGAGRLSNITLDNSGNPVVAADGGSWLYVYQRSGAGTWGLVSVNVANYFANQCYNPYVDVDEKGGIWAGGIMMPLTSGWTTNHVYIPKDAGGIGTVLIRDGSVQFARHHYHPRSWECGNVGYDRVLKQGVVWINQGSYGQFLAAGCPGLMVTTKRGTLLVGRAGEGARIGISKAGPVLHKGGVTQSVWHVASVLHAGYGLSGYQNSARAAEGMGVVGWVDGNYYEHMGEDGCYVSVAGDATMPQTAYMATDLSNDGGAGGVYANVFDGKTMVRPVSDVIQVYPYGGSGSRRFEPLIAPANKGGAFITFCNGGNLYVRYVSPVGVLGQTQTIGKGSKGSLAFDAAGNLHMAYCGSDGKLKYRKVGMSTALEPSAQFKWGKYACQATWDMTTAAWWVKTLSNVVVVSGTAWGNPMSVTVSGDYDGDGYGDMCVWDSAKCKWYIYSPKLAKSLLWDYSWGVPGSKPVSGDYNGDGKSDLAIYDQPNGKWYVVDLAGKALTWGAAWGYSRAVPVSGDYDGDRKADRAVYDEDTGKWYVQSTATGTSVVWGVSLGVKNGMPVSGDFDGDKKSDLCIWDPVACLWYARRTGGKRLLDGYAWGFKGGIPVAGDYDGDGADDIGIFDGLGVTGYGKWYIYSPKKNAVVAWGVDWGYRGVRVAGSTMAN